MARRKKTAKKRKHTTKRRRHAPKKRRKPSRSYAARMRSRGYRDGKAGAGVPTHLLRPAKKISLSYKAYMSGYRQGEKVAAKRGK